jgi:DNA-binding transcriptional LysR family regulator
MSAELLPHLDTFAEAAERSSFTAAARALGLTQSAVSQRIHQLEALLRTPLFRRTGGRVELTDAGRKLHEYARRILDLTAEAWREVTGNPDVIEGELSLAASSVPGHHLLPHALAEFREHYPLVRVKVAVSDTQTALRLVEQGQAHLALVGDRGGGPGLELLAFATDELVLVVPRQHPWWRKRQISHADLRSAPLIQRESGSGSRQCFERAVAVAKRLNVVLELGSTEAIKGAVLEGVGVAVLSRRAVRDDVRAGRLKSLRVEGLELSRDISVAWDRRRVLPSRPGCFSRTSPPTPDRGPHKPD